MFNFTELLYLEDAHCTVFPNKPAAFMRRKVAESLLLKGRTTWSGDV